MGRRSIGTRLAGAFRTHRGSASSDSRMEQHLQELEGTRRALRESHEQLVEMERLAAAEEFASDVADAINNPLAALLGRLQMQLEGKPVDPEAVYFVLRLDTDPIARKAARTYAKEIRATKPTLAAELEEILDGTDK